MRICVQKAGSGGVAFYRIIQPYTYFSNYHNVFINDDTKYIPNRVMYEIDRADILVYQMPWGKSVWETMNKNYKLKNRKKIVIEMDDNIFDCNPFNDAYCNFGTDEVTQTIYDKPTIDFVKSLKAKGVDNPDGSFSYKMWEKGVDKYDPVYNAEVAKCMQECLEMADLVTVSNIEMKKKLSKYRAGEIAIIPNLIDPAKWLPMKKKDDGNIYIGWQGGQAHLLDLLTISQVLIDILNKYPQVKLVFKGAFFYGLYKSISKDRLHFIPWHSDINSYPLDIRDMAIDIGVAPLRDDRFNRCKSNLKWLEYSIMGVPGVYSDIVYGDSIAHGKTGFIARDKKEWFQYLSDLIEHKELRESIGNKARQRILTAYTTDKLSGYIDIFNKL